MTGAALDLDLLRGRALEGVADYAAAWSQDEITVRLMGMADYAACPSLLNKVRGALGQVLLAGASQAVRDRRPCGWTQTCAAEVFFGARPLIRVGGHDSQIAKPYVLSARARGADLEISIRIFGQARAWSSAARLALTSALQERVFWDHLARDLPRPAPHKGVISDVRCDSTEGLADGRDGALAAEIAFATPVSAARGDPGADHTLLWPAMARRLALIAPWHGLTAASLYPELVSCLAELTVEAGSAPPRNTGRLDRAGHRYLNRTVYPPRLKLGRVSPDALAVLRMAQASHIGRGATLGLGQIVLTVSK